MRAAAELDREMLVTRAGDLLGIVAHRDDAHLVAVFLAEEGERALLHRALGSHEARRHLGVLADAGINLMLDRGDILRRQRARIGEIEAQPVGCDERALLRDMLAEAAAQRLMQQMGDRMIGAQIVAPRLVHFQRDDVAELQRAAGHFSNMGKKLASALLRIGHLELGFGRDQRSGVAHLAAGFGVERGLADQHRRLGAGFRLADRFAVLDDGDDAAFGVVRVVAEKFGGAQFVAQLEPELIGRRLARADPGFTRLGALARHRGIEAGDLDLAAAAAQHVLGQIERETVGIVELEGDLAGERRSGREPRLFLVEQLQAARQQIAKSRLLELQGLGDERLGAAQFRVSGAHLAHQHRHEAPHQRLLGAEQMSVAHGAAHDAAQHIAAALLRGQHAVGDEEGRSAQMIGDNAMRHRLLAVGGNMRGLGRGDDERAQYVGIVIVVLALQHGGDPLEPHAGVDRRMGKRYAVVLGELLVLHEDEIPDLDEAVALGILAARRPAGDLVAVIVEDLGARAAGAGIAHRPEIIRGGNADDFLLRQIGDLAPELCRLVIVGIDGDQQLVLRQLQIAGEKIPGERNRALLEIIAEGEIAEHLEEGVVARAIADILEVVMLAAGAHAFLRRGCPDIGALLLAGEDVLELHHAGIGEEQRRIVPRN